MPIYSNSKISTFEQCPLKFKFKYIDKIPPEIEKSIEAHLGDMVHRALEWLYVQVLNKKIPTIEDVIAYYSTEWEEHYVPDIVIVREGLTEKDYFNKGVEFLINYYTKHKPFDDNTLEIEKRIVIDLDKEGEYKVQGFIDRLVYNPETKEYEIHDYKTANNLPKQEKIDNDKQLALYAIAIKELFGQDKEVCLIWHYLAHDKRICSKRTDEQLQQLKKETLEIIKKIELEKQFSYNKSRLCDWCEYKDMCPAWGNKPPKREKQKELEV